MLYIYKVTIITNQKEEQNTLRHKIKTQKELTGPHRGALSRRTNGVCIFAWLTAMSNNFHSNSLVPKWSTIDLPPIDDDPATLAQQNGAANIPQVSSAPPDKTNQAFHGGPSRRTRHEGAGPPSTLGGG